MTQPVSPATIGGMTHRSTSVCPAEEGIPTAANIMGVGLAIAGALVGGLLLVAGALGLAAYVVIKTI